MKSAKLFDFDFIGYQSFSGHENSAARVGITEDEYVLISYSTAVCGFNRNTKQIWCTGSYSTTTAKHITWFARFINGKYGTELTSEDFRKTINENE